mgnify:CR=1 FL=1
MLEQQHNNNKGQTLHIYKYIVRQDSQIIPNL